MAFVRPAVLVYQEFQTATVAPETPDLNTCLVGPAYHIQDYPTDKANISVGNFVKSGFTADAPCLADGSSAGKPDNGTSFVTLSQPPNHLAGGVLDASSVLVTFDALYVELNHGADGAINSGSDPDGNKFTSATGAFLARSVSPGDRIVLTNSSTRDADHTIVKTVKEVISATEIRTTSGFSGTDTTKVGTTSVLWRVEHQLNDQTIDSASYVTVVGNAVTIRTGSNGIRVTYESSPRTVNFAKMYVGYRELRTDLQDVQVLSSVDDIASVIGRVDERNPLAAGCQVAMANTGTTIQVFGVRSDDLTGHQSARDKMTTRSDIYAIVPLTAGLSGADWLSVIAMWTAHCVSYEDPEKSKFRIVLGSYDVLPTEKSSAPPSTSGQTMPSDPTNDPFDVLVDPAIGTTFVTKGVGSAHVLDVSRASGGSSGMNNLTTGQHIFSSGYTGAKSLRGAIGEKRIRTTDASKWSSPGYTSARCCYAVRPKILRSEGGTPKIVLTSVDATQSSSPAGVKLTKTDGFASVAVGDVVHIQGAGVSGYNGGWIVRQKTDDSNVVLYLAYTADSLAIPHVDVYQPDVSGAACEVTSSSSLVKTGAFANVAVGDVLYILRDTNQSGNTGMWVITNVLSDDEVRLAGGGSALTANTSTADFAVFGNCPQTNGDATVTVRQRLTRLKDENATFLTTVAPGEDIEIPYPANTDSTRWDTTVTQWPIDTIVSDEILDAELDELEELAPYQFTVGFSSPSHMCAYRINIDLNSDSQVAELNTITAGLKNRRCTMVWPNQCYVSNLQNELTGIQSKQSGQYLACMLGGMNAGLPSHQGFTYLGGSGIQQLFNSNFYFTDEQLTALRNGGWYVFVQDSETSLPYTIHEVTTDVSAYAFGELMNVRNFDYISLYFKEIMMAFVGRYNVYTDTLNLMRSSLEAGAQYLKLRIFPRIGTPLLDAQIISLDQNATEVDRIECFIEVSMPKVANRIGLHLRS